MIPVADLGDPKEPWIPPFSQVYIRLQYKTQGRIQNFLEGDSDILSRVKILEAMPTGGFETTPIFDHLRETVSL